MNNFDNHIDLNEEKNLNNNAIGINKIKNVTYEFSTHPEIDFKIKNINSEFDAKINIINKDLLNLIEDYYKPKKLIDGLMKLGEIPDNLIESIVGVGFIDIADYSFISKFLSSKENYTVLNGLFSAFNWVLNKYGGYLNKIEGDSMMFQFGCPIDKVLDENNRLYSIARRLFYSCVEMQKISSYINVANEDIKKLEFDQYTKKSLQDAFDIISKVRNDQNTSMSMSAIFQIRIRIGANIGLVSSGNFGPKEAKHWDVIGDDVIKAKRMESTAPIGGLRISEEFYNILHEHGIADEYYKKFIEEAKSMNGYYKNIQRDELFKCSYVSLKDKKNILFKSYSVQVIPDLPESLANQVKALLFKGLFGVNKIIELLKYYRGNRIVIEAIEDILNKLGVKLRKERMMRLLNNKKYKEFVVKFNNDNIKAIHFIRENCSLFSFFKYLSIIQDELKKDSLSELSNTDFKDYGQYVREKYHYSYERYKMMEKLRKKRTFFYDILFSLLFENIKASIYEFQRKYQ